MKSSPTSVSIIRPQSDTSKRQQQKKLNPIKVQTQSKSPTQKKIKDQEKPQSSEAEDNIPRWKADESYPKVRSKQAADSSASKKKPDSEIKTKQSRIKPKVDIVSHTKISTETRTESKTSINKETPYKRKTNNEFNEMKKEKPKYNVKINPKTKETEAIKPKPRVKAPTKNENDSKIPIRTKVKNFNSPSLAKREKTKPDEKLMKKEIVKKNNNDPAQKNTKKVGTADKTKTKTPSESNIKHIKRSTKKDEEEEIEEEEEEEEEEEDDEEEEETISEFDAYKNHQKETLLSKYLQNQNSDNTDLNILNSKENSIISNTNKDKNDQKESNFDFKSANDIKNNSTENQSNDRLILNMLSDLEGENQNQCLDDIIEEVQNWNSDFLKFNFDIYIELTGKINSCLKSKKFSTDVAIFKATAIIVKIAPLSDKELLKNSLSTLSRMSSNGENSMLFIECHLVEPLLKICFDDREIDEMSKSAAKILSNVIDNKQIMYEMLHLEAMQMACKEIASHARRGKFNIEYSYYLNDVLNILIVLCEKSSDFSKYTKYSLPTNLLTILRLYRNDNSIQNKIAEILKTLLDFDENVEQLECEDLSPLFALLDSTNQSTIENAIYAISNAISISDFFVDTVAELEPPLGIVSLCNKLKNDLSNPINSEILKSLIKLTSFRQGAEMAVQSFNKISAFMDVDPYELMRMEKGRTGIVYALQILKNLAYIVPDRVAMAVDGKLKFFCQIGAISVVIELAKILIKTNTGRKVLEEVRDLPQIASMF